MHTKNQVCQQSAFGKPNVSELVQTWRSRLASDYPQQSAANRESIIHWLLGKDLKRFETQGAIELETAQQAMYRYQILRQRYLGATPEQAYRQLMTRLSSLVLRREKISNLIDSSRVSQRQVLDVLQKVVQELIQSDRYIQQQISSIAECTDNGIRNALLLATLEEYCLRPIHNQPLLLYHLINYLHCRVQEKVTQLSTTGIE